MEKIEIPKSNLTVSSSGSVTVESHELANALIQDHKNVITELGVKASEISLSKEGKITISNQGFADKVKAAMKGSAALNVGCGLGC